jgi:hypothetical protein
VIREGDILKIKVPSIIFRENQADFVGLPQEIVDNNIRVLSASPRSSTSSRTTR